MFFAKTEHTRTDTIDDVSRESSIKNSYCVRFFVTLPTTSLPLSSKREIYRSFLQNVKRHVLMFVFSKITGVYRNFCPCRGTVGESPSPNYMISKMCHFASLVVRLTRVKRLYAQSNRDCVKRPCNVWSATLIAFIAYFIYDTSRCL